MSSIKESKLLVGGYITAVLGYDVFQRPEEEDPVNLLKPLRRKSTMKPSPSKSGKLFLRSEHAPCTCPEPCERDHGNE
jgi:hypothetical protein